METIVYEFSVERRIHGEQTEIELRASFEVEPEIKSAELKGTIFQANEEIPWTGKLHPRERHRIEAAAYEAWTDGDMADRYSEICDAGVDCEFDDFRFAGLG